MLFFIVFLKAESSAKAPKVLKDPKVPNLKSLKALSAVAVGGRGCGAGSAAIVEATAAFDVAL